MEPLAALGGRRPERERRPKTSKQAAATATEITYSRTGRVVAKRGRGARGVRRRSCRACRGPSRPAVPSKRFASGKTGEVAQTRPKRERAITGGRLGASCSSQPQKTRTRTPSKSRQQRPPKKSPIPVADVLSCGASEARSGRMRSQAEIASCVSWAVASAGAAEEGRGRDSRRSSAEPTEKRARRQWKASLGLSPAALGRRRIERERRPKAAEQAAATATEITYPTLMGRQLWGGRMSE